MFGGISRLSFACRGQTVRRERQFVCRGRGEESDV